MPQSPIMCRVIGRSSRASICGSFDIQRRRRRRLVDIYGIASRVHLEHCPRPRQTARTRRQRRSWSRWRAASAITSANSPRAGKARWMSRPRRTASPSRQWRYLRELWEEDGLSSGELTRRVGRQGPTTVVAVQLLGARGPGHGGEVRRGSPQELHPPDAARPPPRRDHVAADPRRERPRHVGFVATPRSAPSSA